MNHSDHVDLIGEGVRGAGGVWADLGSGSGAFTLALADLLGMDGVIYSVDRNERALREQERAMRREFPAVRLHQIIADFSKPLDLPPLDGVIAANSLHYVRGKNHVLTHIRESLRPGGRLIVVEYNTDRGNHWVPHPFSFDTFLTLSGRNEFSGARLLATRPSRFLGEIYAAVTFA